MIGPHLSQKLFPRRLMDFCERGEGVSPSDKTAIVGIIEDYMLHNLKTGARSLAQQIWWTSQRCCGT